MTFAGLLMDTHEHAELWGRPRIGQRKRVDVSDGSEV